MTSAFWRGFAVPCAVAGVVAVLGALAGVAMVSRTHSNVRRGWNLVPVVVAARDLKEYELLTQAHLVTRAIPESMVTGSTVPPEQLAKVVGHHVLVPLQANDPLQWSQVSTQPLALVAARDVPRGATLAAHDLKLAFVPSDLTTGSWVTDADQVLGLEVTAPFRSGDPVLRTQLAPRR